MKRSPQATAETRPSTGDPFQRYARGEIRITEFLELVSKRVAPGTIGGQLTSHVSALCELVGYLRAKLESAERRIRGGHRWDHPLPDEDGKPCAGGGVAIPGLKFMDGTPVPEDYQRSTEKLVDEAAEAEELIPIDELEEATDFIRTWRAGGTHGKEAEREQEGRGLPGGGPADV